MAISPGKDEGIGMVRPGPAARKAPQSVLGLDEVSRPTAGSPGLFMARHTVAPGVHSDLHSHANCETAVYVSNGRAYAYSGGELDEYEEAGPGDFAHVPANVAHVVGCPAGGPAPGYVVARNAPEEGVTLRPADRLPIRPDGRIGDAQGV